MGLLDNIHEKLNEALRQSHTEDMAVIQENQQDISKAGNSTGLIKRIALVDPNMTATYGGGGFGLYKPRFSHISFKTLKEMSLRDPIVSSIIQTRINQISAFARPQSSRYDTGYKIMPRDVELDIEKGSEEEAEIVALTEYIINTGVLDDHRDPVDRMDFETWLKLIVRDRLTYGAAAIETIRDHTNRIYAFLPVPTETVFYANKAVDDANIDQMSEMNKPAYFAGAEREQIKEVDKERLKKGEYEYVQVIEGRVVEGFTRNDLVYKLGNPQNFIDNNGYCIGELEMATTTITSHLQAENYNKLFFTHGFAARGLLHIKGDVTPAQLQAFRAQWYAQVSGNSNSWRTPIIAGVDEVEWVSLSANNREMEYSNYIDHIIRILCSLFQISPLEIGMDYLTRGSGAGGLGESDNEWKIEDSQDRGLRPLLVWLESIINSDILPYAYPELADKYKFCFVGLDAESKEQELERQEKELKLHTSIDDIRKEIDKDPILAGKVILNADYIAFLFRTHTVGEIREMLLGYPEDSKNPLFDYIADGPFLDNKQMLMAPAGVDEDGNPIEGGDGDEPGGEKLPAGSVQVEPGVEEAVAMYLEEHPEIVEKSLMKSVDPNKINSRFDKLRSEYITTYKSVQAQMLKEILESVKDEIQSGEDDKPIENK